MKRVISLYISQTHTHTYMHECVHTNVPFLLECCLHIRIKNVSQLFQTHAYLCQGINHCIGRTYTLPTYAHKANTNEGHCVEFIMHLKPVFLDLLKCQVFHLVDFEMEISPQRPQSTLMKQMETEQTSECTVYALLYLHTNR